MRGGQHHECERHDRNKHVHLEGGGGGGDERQLHHVGTTERQQGIFNGDGWPGGRATVHAAGASLRPPIAQPQRTDTNQPRQQQGQLVT